MSWYLAPSLAVLRAEIDARWPNRDRTSDGTIGDENHAGMNSDHNPNSRDSVNALDIDADGVDMSVIIDSFERHPSSQYWIWQRTIANRSNGWTRRSYTGSNPHVSHCHFSIQQSRSAEQDTRPWGVYPPEDEMNEAQERKLTDVHYTTTEIPYPGHSGRVPLHSAVNFLAGDVRALQSKVDELSSRLPTEPTVITDEQLERVLRRVIGSVDEVGG